MFVAGGAVYCITFWESISTQYGDDINFPVFIYFLFFLCTKRFYDTRGLCENLPNCDRTILYRALLIFALHKRYAHSSRLSRGRLGAGATRINDTRKHVRPRPLVRSADFRWSREIIAAHYLF